jgi:type I restriction enzyme R subunit
MQILLLTRHITSQAEHMGTSTLTEQEVRSRYITPALQKAGWPLRRIREEYAFTDGRVIQRGNMHTRGTRKQIDYLLEYKPNNPLAVVEAKRNDKSLGTGMQQGIDYAEALEHASDLDVPFVYCSNGDGFIEHDRTKTEGERERVLPMDQFPSPDALWQRYRDAKDLSGEQEEVVLQEYYTEIDGKTPRYYQFVAINRAVEAYVKGQDRMLLVMATGTGKTFTAFQIIWRLWKAGEAKRILFLADRNVLADQAITNDFRDGLQADHRAGHAHPGGLRQAQLHHHGLPGRDAQVCRSGLRRPPGAGVRSRCRCVPRSAGRPRRNRADPGGRRRLHGRHFP